MPEMSLISRGMKAYNSVYRYSCQNCGETLELVPPASIGVGISVGSLALIFWGFILFRGSGATGLLPIVLFALAACALAAVWLPQVFKYWLFPTAPNRPVEVDIRTDKTTSFYARLILRLENMGFLFGLVAPIAFIAGVLGVAALIGYVNFTFFE